jgi:hypothetical protein
MLWASGDRFPSSCPGYTEMSVADMTEGAGK